MDTKAGKLFGHFDQAAYDSTSGEFLAGSLTGEIPWEFVSIGVHSWFSIAWVRLRRFQAGLWTVTVGGSPNFVTRSDWVLSEKSGLD